MLLLNPKIWQLTKQPIYFMLSYFAFVIFFGINFPVYTYYLWNFSSDFLE